MDDDFLLYVDYPIIQQNKRGNSITIHLDGDKEMSCNLKIFKLGNQKINMKVFQDKELLKGFHESSRIHQYKISGHGAVKVQW